VSVAPLDVASVDAASRGTAAPVELVVIVVLVELVVLVVLVVLAVAVPPFPDLMKFRFVETFPVGCFFMFGSAGVESVVGCLLFVGSVDVPVPESDTPVDAVVGVSVLGTTATIGGVVALPHLDVTLRALSCAAKLEPATSSGGHSYSETFSDLGTIAIWPSADRSPADRSPAARTVTSFVECRPQQDNPNKPTTVMR